MQYRILGKTGLSVSVFGIGAWQLGGPLVLDGKADGHPDIGAETAVQLMHLAFDAGVNLVDTAEQYGDGECERRVGRAVRGRREKIVISTKFGARRGPMGERVNDAGPATIRSSLEGSLRRLGTDHVDIFLYHVPPKRTDHAEGFRILEDLKREGKIRFHGISINSLGVLKQFVELGNIDILQYNHNLLHPQEELRALQAREGWGGVIRGALAGGRLSGKYSQTDPDFHPDDVRRSLMMSGRLKPADFAESAELRDRVPAGWTLPQFALRHLLDFPETHVILLGGKNRADYESALAVADLTSTPAHGKQKIPSFS